MKQVLLRFTTAWQRPSVLSLLDPSRLGRSPSSVDSCPSTITNMNSKAACCLFSNKSDQKDAFGRGLMTYAFQTNCFSTLVDLATRFQKLVNLHIFFVCFLPDLRETTIYGLYENLGRVRKGARSDQFC